MGLHRSNLLASVRAGGNAQLLDIAELLPQGDPGGNAPTVGAGGTPGKHSPSTHRNCAQVGSLNFFPYTKRFIL